MNQSLYVKRRPLTWILLAAVMGALLWAMGSGFPKQVPRALEPLGGILFVTGLAFLVPWALKSIGNRLPQGTGLQGSLIEIKGAKPVGQGRSLLVVEVEGEKFLLCSGRDGLEMLARLPSKQDNFSSQGQEERP